MPRVLRQIALVVLLFGGIAQATPTDFGHRLTWKEWAKGWGRTWLLPATLELRPTLSLAPAGQGLYSRRLVLLDMPDYAMPVFEIGVLWGPMHFYPLPGDPLRQPGDPPPGRIRADASFPGAVELKLIRLNFAL